MDNDCKLTRIGKRMPYTVPKGFFDEMEQNIRQEALPKTANNRHLRRWLRPASGIWLTAAAASIALMVTLCPKRQVEQADTTMEVERAFVNLSDEDQTYMLEVYQEDIFINE